MFDQVVVGDKCHANRMPGSVDKSVFSTEWNTCLDHHFVLNDIQVLSSDFVAYSYYWFHHKKVTIFSNNLKTDASLLFV